MFTKEELEQILDFLSYLCQGIDGTPLPPLSDYGKQELSDLISRVFGELTKD